MKIPEKYKSKLSYVILGLALVAVVITVFFGSMPKKYALKVGDTSQEDIVAPRAIADHAETERRAREAMTQVPQVVMRSEERSEESLGAVNAFIELVIEKRATLYPDEEQLSHPDDREPENTTESSNTPLPLKPSSVRPYDTAVQLAASSLISACDQNLNIVIPSGTAEELMCMETERFVIVCDSLKTETEALVLQTLDSRELSNAIDDIGARLSELVKFNKDDVELTTTLLEILVRPNIEYNVDATMNARQAAYERVMNNPVMVNRGTRIISQGDIITADMYAMLQALDLTESSHFNWKSLVGIIGLVLVLALIAQLFFRRYTRDLLRQPRNLLALVLAVILTLIVSAYLAGSYPLTPPVYFCAVVLTAYFGFRTSVFMSIVLVVLISPMVNFSSSFVLIALTGSVVAALITKGISRHDNYAKIILATAGANLLMTLSIGLLEKESWSVITSNCAQTTLSGILSVIVGIGIMPLFEMIFNTVSPLRLIELSQPGHPLLKRLFVEAPGTSQHSMMVANLADSAAEAVGANSMIARVGSYFHDVGKLENPLMFTENQKGVNPHDNLPPEESARIITKHPEDSLRIGRRYRLPAPVLRIAQEHHGTTVLRYFYHKACEEAEANGEPKPSSEQFRYRTPIPSSPESAIVMLADSTEAAMRSSGINNIADAEKKIRDIVKIKVDQDQLIQSGLSFAQIERIIQSFLQVYAGHFHERVPYPSDNNDHQ